MKTKQIILLMICSILGVTSTVKAQSLEYHKTKIKCIAGDCKNGEGIGYLIHQYRKTFRTTTLEKKDRIFLVKAHFLNEKINGFASILDPYSGNDKEFLKIKKELKLYSNLKSLVDGKYPFRTAFIIEGNFKNNIPQGTLKFYDYEYTNHNNYSGKEEFELSNSSVWEWREFYELEISENKLEDKVIGRVFYGKSKYEYALRKIHIYNDRLPYTQLDSVKIDFEGGYLKFSDITIDPGEIYGTTNGLKEERDFFQIDYKEFVLNNKKVIRKKSKNPGMDLITTIENGKTTIVEKPHYIYYTKYQDSEETRIAKSNNTKKNIKPIWCSCKNCKGIGTIDKPYNIKDVESYYQKSLKTGNVYRVVNVKENSGIGKVRCEVCNGTGKEICN